MGFHAQRLQLSAGTDENRIAAVRKDLQPSPSPTPGHFRADQMLKPVPAGVAHMPLLHLQAGGTGHLARSLFECLDHPPGNETLPKDKSELRPRPLRTIPSLNLQAARVLPSAGRWVTHGSDPTVPTCSLARGVLMRQCAGFGRHLKVCSREDKIPLYSRG